MYDASHGAKSPLDVNQYIPFLTNLKEKKSVCACMCTYKYMFFPTEGIRAF